MKSKKIATLYDLATMMGRKTQEVLYLAQEANALDMRSGDMNIYVDVDKLQNHIDSIIIEELRVINGKNREVYNKG